MECFTPVPTSSISDIVVSRLAKVCKFMSIGVFSNQCPDNHYHIHGKDPSSNIAQLRDNCSDQTNETEFYCERVVPCLAQGRSKDDVCSSIDGGLLKLFGILSSLKLAYVKLQQAHIPYNPEKIIAADDVFMTELEALCKIKHAYKWKLFTKTKVDSSRFEGLQKKTGVNKRSLEKLKSRNSAIDSKIFHLRKELQDLVLQNVISSERIRWENLAKKNASFLNVNTVEKSFKAACGSIHDFAKPLINLMKTTGWDLDKAVDSIVGEVVYAKRSHKKYAFESYIMRRMFHGLSSNSYNVEDVMRFDDPIEFLMRYPDSGFGNFCRNKYLLVVHPKLEFSFFTNLDQRRFVLSGKHPRTPFYHMFAKMAKWIWVLSGIAASADPQAKMFKISPGCDFSGIYMDPVEVDFRCADLFHKNPKIGFMIMPGFKIGDTMVKSRVYLSGIQ